MDGLSAGQATLLSMFGTLLRYGDVGGNLSLPNLEGICLIDEIGAHMHIDLQHQVLPALIKQFPRIQFIVASHSPLFVLGMEQAFEPDGLAVIDLPLGTEINAEAYAEFGRALEVVQETKAFARAISDAALQSGKPLVLFEGETDPIYCRAAAEVLGHATLLDEVELDWVGAKDPAGGQGYNTGDTGLKTTYNALRANQGLMSRSVLLVYDNDTGKPASDEGMLFVRTIPGDPMNTEITAGIESLLPEEVFGVEMFDTRTTDKGNGKTVTIKGLNKMRLCRHVCDERQKPEDFTGFKPLLDMLEEICLKSTSGEDGLAEEAQPSPEDASDCSALGP